MTVKANINVYGIKEALKELNKIQPSLRREITRNYKQIVSSVIDHAKSRIPRVAPMSGMRRQWRTKSGWELLPPGGWNGSIASKFVQARINTRKVKMFRGNAENVGAFSIRWLGLIDSAVEMAGRKSSGTISTRSRMGSHGRKVGTVGGPQMIAVLNARYGQAGRFLWYAWEKQEDTVTRAMVELVNDVMRQVNRNMVAEGLPTRVADLGNATEVTG